MSFKILNVMISHSLGKNNEDVCAMIFMSFGFVFFSGVLVFCLFFDLVYFVAAVLRIFLQSQGLGGLNAV